MQYFVDSENRGEMTKNGPAGYSIGWDPINREFSIYLDGIRVSRCPAPYHDIVRPERDSCLTGRGVVWTPTRRYTRPGDTTS